MNRSILCIALALVSAGSFGQAKKPATTATKPAAKTAATPSPFKTEMDSVSYSIGLLFAQNLKAQGIDNINVTLLSKALSDAKLNKTPLLKEDDVRKCMTEFQMKMGTAKNAAEQKENAAKAAVNRQEAKVFHEQNSKRTGVTTLPDGLQYEVMKAGPADAQRPTLANKVKVHYHGTLLNGTVFDSSVDRGEPVSFPLGNVVKGWQEALQLMTVGSKWKVYLPADLGYGDQQAGPNIPPGSTLVFEIELLGIEQ